MRPNVNAKQAIYPLKIYKKIIFEIHLVIFFKITI